MAILTYFSKSVYWMLLIFAIETNFLVLKNAEIFFPAKNLKFDFSAPFWPQNGHFSPKTAILTYFSKSVHWMLLIFAIEANFLVLKKNGEIFFSPKNLKLDFSPPFWSPAGGRIGTYEITSVRASVRPSATFSQEPRVQSVWNLAWSFYGINVKSDDFVFCRKILNPRIKGD